MDNKPFYFVAACLAVVIGALLYISRDLLDRSPPAHNEALARWRAAELRDYDLRIQTYCFCDARPLIVQVRHGDVIQVRIDDEQAMKLESPYLEFFTLTVEDAFARIARAYSKSSEYIFVTYDPKFGYPTHAQVDESKDTVDDEWIMTLQLTEVPHGA